MCVCVSLSLLFCFTRRLDKAWRSSRAMTVSLAVVTPCCAASVFCAIEVGRLKRFSIYAKDVHKWLWKRSMYECECVYVCICYQILRKLRPSISCLTSSTQFCFLISPYQDRATGTLLSVRSERECATTALQAHGRMILVCICSLYRGSVCPR